MKLSDIKLVLIFYIIIFFEWFLNHPSMRYGGYILVALPFLIFTSLYLSKFSYNLKKIKKISYFVLGTSIIIFNLQNIKNNLVKSYQIKDINPIKFRNIEKIKSLSKLSPGGKVVIFVIFSIGALILLQKTLDQNETKEIRKPDYVYIEKKLTSYDTNLRGNAFTATVVNDTGKIISQVELFYKEGGCQQPTKAMVALAQEKLNRMGYTAGPADGIYGNKTRQAIKRSK